MMPILVKGDDVGGGTKNGSRYLTGGYGRDGSPFVKQIRAEPFYFI